jgi:superfamily II DNA or RNA helicase
MKLSPRIKPRSWQRHALTLWIDGFRGIVRVVTGGGKTVFAYLCMQSFLEKFPDGRITILVPTLALLDQWLVDLTESFEIAEDEVGCFHGNSRPTDTFAINIMTLNTGRLAAPRLFDGESRPALLIVDECHRAGSSENARALEGAYAATLGLSATPERERDDGFDSKIVPALGPLIFEYAYGEASKDRVIVDFDLINVEVTAEGDQFLTMTSLGARIDRLHGASQHGLSEEREKAVLAITLAKAETALRAPWAVKLVLAHRDQRVIVFHESVDSAERIADLLQKCGQNAVVYHSQMSDSHRRDNLRLFRRGMVNVLVTCRALDEGANIPEANVAIVARSTSSTRQRIQRLGRVLRPAPGKEHAIVYTLFRGDEERGRLHLEETDLVGIAAVHWKKGSVR